VRWIKFNKYLLLNSHLLTHFSFFTVICSHKSEFSWQNYHWYEHAISYVLSTISKYIKRLYLTYLYILNQLFQNESYSSTNIYSTGQKGNFIASGSYISTLVIFRSYIFRFFQPPKRVNIEHPSTVAWSQYKQGLCMHPTDNTRLGVLWSN
jgi:hypothetical protein